MSLQRCPLCSGVPTVEQGDYDWHVICHDCYDGAPDAGRQSLVYGKTRENAIRDWTEYAEDARDEGNELARDDEATDLAFETENR